MKMTDEQAATYCDRQARISLFSRGPGGEHTSSEWRRLRNEIKDDGLEATEARLNAWKERLVKDTDPRHTADTTNTDRFLDVIYDDEEIDQCIASEIRYKIEDEITKLEKDNSTSLRLCYLRYFRDHLSNVEEGVADLDAVEGPRDDMLTQIELFEGEYSQLIIDARAAQED